MNSLDRIVGKVTLSEQAPIANEIKKLALLLVKKILKAKVCETFNNSFEIRTHNKFTRNNGFLFQIHKIHLQLTKSCFHSMGVKFYNSLPIEHRQAECTGDIKGFLKSIFIL